MIKVHSIETFGTHEGPGIRFVIFTQGCNFCCLYCQNPDTINQKGGENFKIAKLLELIDKNKVFYQENGGVTISGGEPLVQAKKIIPLFKALKKRKIKTALDTNGSFLNNDVKKLLKYTDLVLLDIKHFDNEMHQKITGRENKTVLEFADYLEEKKIPFWLRHVLVPGLTDQSDHLEQLRDYFAKFKSVLRVEILPYHTLGKHKYAELKIPYRLEKTAPPDKEMIEKTKKLFENSFSNVYIR